MKRLIRNASLTSKVDENGSKIRINIFDTDNENALVMWMDLTIQSSVSKSTGIYVNMINFDDKLFFAMPKNRQDNCGVVLLKKFMKYYKTNWGKDSGNWLPVNADFVNYGLQEMVSNGIESGTFHPDSLKDSKLTNKKQWDNEPLANMENRKIGDAFTKDPNSFFPELTFNTDGYTENIPFSKIEQSYSDFIQNYPMFKDDYGENCSAFYGHIKNNIIYVPAPHKKYEQYPGAVEFTYQVGSGFLKIDEDVEDIGDKLNDINVINNVFDTVNTISDLYGNSYDKSSFISSLNQKQT